MEIEKERDNTSKKGAWTLYFIFMGRRLWNHDSYGVETISVWHVKIFAIR